MAILVGIDPGVNTGLAMWDTEAKELRACDTWRICQAMHIVLLNWEKIEQEVVVVMEDARQRKWIPREQSLSQFKGRAMGAGSIRRDCQIWEEFCDTYGIKLVKVPPRKGMTKWSAESFARVTGWKGRTSNHARDAAMLVFGK